MNPYPDTPHAGPRPRFFSSDHSPVHLDEYYGDATDPIANSFVLPPQHEPYYFRNITQDGYEDCFEQDAIPLRLQRPENETNYFQNDEDICKPPLAALREHQRHFGHDSTDHTPPESTSDRKEYVYPSHLRRSHGENISYEGEGVYSQIGRLPHGQNPRLRPVSELPDVYRGVFKFGVFNAIQSICFDEILTSDINMVISAPTGSGKTVLFELAIIRMLTHNKNDRQSKCIYIAPTKALCSERFRDWSTKFDPIGFKCCELTGDTVIFGNNVWGDAKDASIIITTSEKWDSLTRNWRDHSQILSWVHLFLVDEVHILNESRGSTLEVITSRMKIRGSGMRFVLVSATVPNIQDIASWIGNGSDDVNPAKVFEFGEDFRPCKLTRHVIGIPRRNEHNDFQFAKILDYKLFSVLQQYSIGKPILVFCSTRKGVFDTAEQLMKEFVETEQKKLTLPWSRPIRLEHSFIDKRIDELVKCGIGVHHAGVNLDDRRVIEGLYLRKSLRILVATSTLAVGVNLPAHMVVIKGVKTYQNNASVEYSDLDIVQMLGRAGRPQFDKDGIAIIMCEKGLESKYEALVRGKTVLESSLHLNLSEHINSEIGLGTITDLDSAKSWLRGSFLFQRIRKNPNFYALGKEDGQTWQERVDDVVMKSVMKLRDTHLVVYIDKGAEVGKLTCTEYGEIMSKFYIRQTTMSLILNLPDHPSVRDMLETISAAEELCDKKLRTSEKAVYNKLRNHLDIRFEVKKIEKTSDKVFLLIQAVLGGIGLKTEFRSTDSQPYLEASSLFRHAPRIARAIVEVAVAKKVGAQVKYGLELVRCLTAKAWEDRPIVLKQVEHIGEKSIKVLGENGIASLGALRSQTPLRIETLLNRRPPFGMEVLACANELPQYHLSITELEMRSSGGKGSVEVDISIDCGLLEPDEAIKVKKQKHRVINMTAVLTLTSTSDFIDFRRIPTRALKGRKTFEVTAKLTKPSQSIIVVISSESVAGSSVQRVHKPIIPATEFPVVDTRPLSSIESDLVGLEDDPDFWNMPIDDSEDEIVFSKAGSKRKKDCAETQDGDTVGVFGKPKVEPRKLQNGKYECNHPCKDKTQCRHFCCRDGLSEAPDGPKKRHTDVVEKRPVPKIKRLHAAKANVSSHKNDLKIKELETVHERANVSLGLHLSDGQRLKLDSSHNLRRKYRPAPNFDIAFTDLKDAESSYCGQLFEVDLDGDDDLNDLPEGIFPLPHNKSSPETNYSNSEVDDLIRTLPLSQENTPAKSVLGCSWVSPVSSSPTVSFRRPPKKRKLDNEVLKLDQELDSLFYQTSEDSELTDSPILVKQPEASDLVDRLVPLDFPDKLQHTPMKSIPDMFEEQAGQTRLVSQVHPTNSGDSNDNEFTELDAWLESGSVQIV